jgi:hypothetical protein
MEIALDDGAPSEPLGSCHGYRVVARDGLCGEVKTPLFPPDSGEADFLVIGLRSRIEPLFPIVPAALVSRIDVDRELVYLDASEGELATLPVHLPRQSL